MLDQALTAASAHDVRGALVAMLEVWRRLPDPRIALAVGELARHAAGCRPGTPAPVLRPTAWDEACARRDPIELDALLANVLKGSATTAADRLDAFAAPSSSIISSVS